MTKKQTKPLNAYEQELEQFLESEKHQTASDLKSTQRMLQEAATRHKELSQTKPITIRVNQLDLIKLKAKAKKSNIPYQTLLSALIHDFATGKRKLTI